jgi:hypothetical protein
MYVQAFNGQQILEAFSLATQLEVIRKNKVARI